MGDFIVGFRDLLALIILMGVTIFIHELGHFLVALRAGMVIDTFSMGFGPAIWQKRWRGINLKISWIPFGGYVALPQLDPTGMAMLQGEVEGKPADPRMNRTISPWTRIAVVLAGPLGNVLLAILLAYVIQWTPRPPPSVADTGHPEIGLVDPDSVAYAEGIRMGDMILAVNGKPVQTWYDYTVECILAGGRSEPIQLGLRGRNGDERNVMVPLELDADSELWLVPGIERTFQCLIAEVVPGSVAEAAGLRANDIVLAVDGARVVSTGDFIEQISARTDVPLALTLNRGGTERVVSVVPVYDPGQKRGLIGVVIRPALQAGDLPWMRHRNPWAQLRSDATAIVRILKALVTPGEARQAAGALGGPVMIFMALWAAIKVSFLNAVGFLRFLNVNLAILNLLPIPVLDGGHIVFSLWEGITRRRVSPRVVNVLTNVFAVLLISAIVAITFNDIKRLFARNRRNREALQPVAEAPAEPGESLDTTPAGESPSGE